MPERVPEKALDRLRWLVNGKPTASEFEALGGSFDPHLHFVALLPSSALPAAESENVQKYFNAMLEALEPVREAIAAYSLQGVMSRAPVSDFSLKVQFSDPITAARILKVWPRDLASSVAPINALRAIAEGRSTEPPEAGANMFSRKKQPDHDYDQASNDAAPSPAAAAMPGNSPQADALRVPTGVQPEALSAAPQTIVPQAVAPQTPVPPPIVPPSIVAPSIVTPSMVPPSIVTPSIVPQPLPQPAVRAPMNASEPTRKKLLIAEDITIRGDILGCEHLAIAGEADSTIERCGRLEVLENGTFKGSATVVDAEISGYCEGTLVVRNTLHIRATGHIVGSVQCGCLQVEEGGRIQGEMKMSPPPNGQASPEPDARPDNPLWAGLAANVSSRSDASAAQSAYFVAKI